MYLLQKTSLSGPVRHVLHCTSVRALSPSIMTKFCKINHMGAKA